MNAALTISGIFLSVLTVGLLAASVIISPWFMVLAGAAFVVLGFGFFCFGHN